MARTTAFLDLGFIRLDRKKKDSLVQQLYAALRDAILSGQLAKGHRLPSTRIFATDIGVSRMTVVNAFDQLTAEGYLEGSVGRGTYVNEQLPEEKQLLRFRLLPGGNAEVRRSQQAGLFSRRGIEIGKACVEEHNDDTELRPFRAGVPALDQFPMEIWSRLSRKRWKEVSTKELTYGEVAGYMPLREAIAGYVRASRGVRCEASQVFIVSGTQQAVNLVARITTDPGDGILFEDPGYVRARSAFKAAGGKIIPVPVDANGMDVDQATSKFPNARIAYVTPSHQYPMGVMMSIERRMKLIEWANRTGGLILEDDYDSEYRYTQRPIPAMQGLDHGNRTIYVGSCSKVIFPSLSIGYAIVPPGMVSLFEKALSLVGRPVATFDQMVLTDFIGQGYFARHLRRMRTIHQQRRTALVTALEERFGDTLHIVGADAGLHCTALFADNRPDVPVVAAALERDVFVKAVSTFYAQAAGAGRRTGLVFGFAETPAEIQSAIERLSGCIQRG